MMENQHPKQSVQLTLWEEPEAISNPEYNLGKFAGRIFAYPNTKDLEGEKTHKFPTKFRGEEVTGSITVTPKLGKRRPTTTTYKLFIALTRLWHKQGCDPRGVVSFSNRMIAKETGWPQNGIVSDRIREHLEILQATSLSFAMVFKNPTDTDRIVNDFTVLQEAGYITRRDMLSKEKWSQNHG